MGRLAKAGLMVHEVCHSNVLVVAQSLHKSLWQIGANVFVKVNLALFPELHDGNPDS